MSELPQTIGKYQIKSLLGEGAMGVVYEGFDSDIERRIAIKTLHPHLINEKNGVEFLQRFKREAKSAAQCIHPNVVTVLEYGQDGDTPFLAMEFIEGASLAQLLNKGQTISVKKSLLIIFQLLKALNAAHKLGIIHRDVKSANIMAVKGGGIKLADFGVARFTQNSEMTMVGSVVGTPKFMSPEQMFGLPTDMRSDLFSVTIVLLDLLKAMPKNHTMACSTLPNITGLPPSNKVDYAIEYPTLLIPLLVKGLAPLADDRFQSASEFATTIKQVLSELKASDTMSNKEPVAANESLKLEDVDSMTEMLRSYVGPIAKNIMSVHGLHNNTLEGLASSVSMEIPKEKERQDFLNLWRSQSSISQFGNNHEDMSLSGNSSGSQKRIDKTQIVDASELINSNLKNEMTDEELLVNLRESYIQYIGPLAKRLIQHYSQQTKNMEVLINKLADEIPNNHDKQQFRQEWLSL
jgi:serine/threonine-protein kinase